MLAEPALIVARAENSLELRAARAEHCNGCSMRQGCGGYVLAIEPPTVMLNARDCDFVGDPTAFKPGSSIQLCLEESAVLHMTLMFYLLPLVPLLLITLLASVLTANEGLVILAALAGLGLGFGFLPHFLQWQQQRQPWRPQLRERPPLSSWEAGQHYQVE